jgi:FkbM family methyltransferase
MDCCNVLVVNKPIRTKFLDCISILMKKCFRGSFIHRSKIANRSYQLLWRLLAVQNSTRSIEFRDLSFVVPSDEITILPSLIDGTYESDEINHFLALLKTDAVVLDIGANIGIYSLPIARHLTEGYLFAFEPSTESSRLLVENISRNHIRNIEVIEKAASSVSGKHIFLSSEIGGRRRIVENQAGDEVSGVIIDDWIAERQLTVDAIKIDVEGWESSVLEGMENLLQSLPVLLLECNMVAQGRNIHKFSEQLQFLFAQYDQIVSFDGSKVTKLVKSDWRQVSESKDLVNLLFFKNS